MQPMEGGDQQIEEDYYSNFARRVYFIAEQEGWDRAKTMRYFNDRKAFEKFYTNVSSHCLARWYSHWLAHGVEFTDCLALVDQWQNKKIGVEERIPNCVKRLMMDSQQRTEQKIRDERAKAERDRQEEERLLQESKMIQKQRRKQAGTRKFSQFIEDQIHFQFRRQENLNNLLVTEIEENGIYHQPEISEKSRALIAAKAET